MSKRTVIELPGLEGSPDALTELLRSGAQQLISQAVEAELQDLLGRIASNAPRRVKRRWFAMAICRSATSKTGIGPVTVRVPKVRSKNGRSGDVPFGTGAHRYVRKAQSLEAALPWLYLKGISSGEMESALKVLLGPQASGLSASTVSRLKQVWGEEYRQWCGRRLDTQRWVYIWVDGIYSGLRADDTKLCALVLIGVNDRGQKQFLAIEDGIRESTQSWREVLLGLKARGMNAPKLAVGDGAMGFWAAAEELFPETAHQRCWMHKTGNVLNALPKAVQPKAKSALHEIWQAETQADAEKAFDQFITTYEPKYPKATTCLLKDREKLLAFFNFPAKHWQSLRTTNPIESTFGTIRHRTKRSKGCLNRDGMLHNVWLRSSFSANGGEIEHQFCGQFLWRATTTERGPGTGRR